MKSIGFIFRDRVSASEWVLSYAAKNAVYDYGRSQRECRKDSTARGCPCGPEMGGYLTRLSRNFFEAGAWSLIRVGWLTTDRGSILEMPLSHDIATAVTPFMTYPDAEVARSARILRNCGNDYPTQSSVNPLIALMCASRDGAVRSAGWLLIGILSSP